MEHSVMPAKKRIPDNKLPRMPAQDKKMRFIQEYCRDNNGAAAAARAGYAPKSAHVTASRLLRDANIRAEIKKAQEELAAFIKLSAFDYWIRLRELYDFDPAELFDENGILKDLKEIPYAIRKCVKRYKVVKKIIDGKDVVLMEVNLVFPDQLAVLHEVGKALGINC